MGNKWRFKGCLRLAGNRPFRRFGPFFWSFPPLSGRPGEHLGNPENGGKRPFPFRYPQICSNPLSETPICGTPTTVKEGKKFAQNAENPFLRLIRTYLMCAMFSYPVGGQVFPKPSGHGCAHQTSCFFLPQGFEIPDRSFDPGCSLLKVLDIFWGVGSETPKGVPKLVVYQIASENPQNLPFGAIGSDTLSGAKEPPKHVPQLLVHQICEFLKVSRH